MRVGKQESNKKILSEKMKSVRGPPPLPLGQEANVKCKKVHFTGQRDSEIFFADSYL
jgi:hypothetical protein